MKYCIFIIYSLSIIVLSCTPESIERKEPEIPEYEKDDISIICERIVDTIIQDAVIDFDNASEYYTTMCDDGSWADIDYQDDEPSDWKPSWHIQRLRLIALAYYKKDSPLYRDSLLWAKVKTSLEYWAHSNAHSSNWWWPYIGEPMYLVDVLLLFKREHNVGIDSELYEKLMSRIPEFNPEGFTGANKADISAIQMKYALYEENNEVISKSFSDIYSSVAYGAEESAFKWDYSYWETIPHIYLGGYSEVLMSNVIHYAYLARCTAYQIPEERLDILRKYTLGLYSSVIRGHVMAFNCHGRSISRNEGSLDKSRFGNMFSKLGEIDSKYANEYKSFIVRLCGDELPSYGIDKSNFHCFVSDYMSHVREGFSVAVRMVSENTWRDEYENNENLKGYFIADGSTNIAVTGDEYLDIMPLWNWTYIPGTTAPNIDNVPLPFWGQTGSSSFCGGVSDGVYGVSTLKYFDDYKGLNTGANKGYFMFDDELVCLGSNVRSDHECHTAVDQCWQKGTSTFCTRNGVLGTASEESDIHLSNSEILWCSNNGLGYYFPCKSNVDLIAEKRQGTWYDINHGYGTTDIKEGRVFQLSISHKNDDKYAYIVHPLATVDMPTYVKNCLIQVLQNTDSIQAVYHKGLNMVQAIFYESGSFEVCGYEITVSEPCVLLIPKLVGSGMDVYISDPMKVSSGITISVVDKNTNNILSGIVNLTDCHLGQSKHIYLN